MLTVVKANGWMGMKERAPPLVGHWERFVEGGMPVFPILFTYCEIKVFTYLQGDSRGEREEGGGIFITSAY